MNNKPTRFYSNKQERRIAKAVGGKQIANSGAVKFNKGDVKTDRWLFEAKTKTSPSGSMTIKKEWLDKNVEEARGMGKRYNALVIDFGQACNYYIVDEKTFLKMKEALDNYETD